MDEDSSVLRAANTWSSAALRLTSPFASMLVPCSTVAWRDWLFTLPPIRMLDVTAWVLRLLLVFTVTSTEVSTPTTASASACALALASALASPFTPLVPPLASALALALALASASAPAAA